MTPNNPNGCAVFPAHWELGDYVEAFEQARLRGEVDLADFLPPAEHPLYRGVLLELIRVDLDHGWRTGRPRPLPDYQGRFPDLFADPVALKEVAFDEYRLRRRAGENPRPDDYKRRYGVSTAGWPPPFLEGDKRPRLIPCSEPGQPTRAREELTRVARAYREFRNAPPTQAAVNAPWNWEGEAPVESGAASEPTDLFRDLHRADPEAADRLSRALTSFPAVGSEFQGFRLLEELGQGAFGKVFLAQQGELANRWVALKIATDLFGESQLLAQLQHTHIVPIHSVHHAPPFQAVCMPYYGCTTLADVLREFAAAQRLPLSGAGLVEILHRRRAGLTQRSGQDLPLPTGTGLALLEQMTYVQAILWLGCRLADGLAHAHDRGILHRDLKPANVLLSEDGQPMLLDFNLSADTKLRGSAAAAAVGGTLPYMAPEQLEAIREGRQPADPRSDLYSFGVILYELLTGLPPFPRDMPLPLMDTVERMIADRRHRPRVRPHNQAVSPALEAILLHCLEPDSTRRYQSARELADDLQRQLENQPLRHAREPSLRERTQKWVRRHPRLASWSTLATVGGTLLLTLALLLGYQAYQSAQREQAQQTFHWFQEEMRSARFLLNTHGTDREKRRQGLASCERVLERYQVLRLPSWQQSPLLDALRAGEQQQLREDVGEILWLLARTTLADAAGPEPIERALHLNALAETCYAAGEPPPTLWSQRAECLRRLGRENEARFWAQRAEQVLLRTARDHYLRGTELVVQGRLAEALPLLAAATDQDPRHFWAWFIRGVCHDQLAQATEAVSCYTFCIALWPEYPWSYFNRGLVYLRQRDHDRAGADFDRAGQLEPQHPDIHLHRALAHQGQGNYQEAIADLTAALDHGASACRVHFLRARIRELAGDPEGARRDRQEGLRRQPGDEHDWLARGLARLTEDPAGAAADFRQALALNPRSLPALQNLAHVLADTPGGLDEAIQLLHRTVRLYPGYVPARSGRGVLLARKGEREPALRDAQEALRRDSSPRILYQVAGIYAQTSRLEAEDREEAFRLLSAALRTGFGFELLDRDRDLDPLRDRPQFRRLIETAQTSLAR
jgi:serine/threonine protein kinase/Flp pilus assembly protein TadD